jgi:hypothetical protein
MLKTLKYNGCEYYYYPEDVMIGEYTGQKNVYAQDADGNEYTIVWGDDGLISEIIPM